MLVNMNHTQPVPKFQPAKQVAFQGLPKKDVVSFSGVEQAAQAVPKSFVKNAIGLVTKSIGGLIRMVMAIPKAIVGLVHKL